MLGTLIFEWEAGYTELKKLLEQPDKFAIILANLAKFHGFDGW